MAPGQWRDVALSDDEYKLIVEKLGREPSHVELGMFGAMWSEHCGYKHSRPLLKTLPTEAPWVLQGPGENAGAIDIGDGLAVVFKVESHNHPSAVEPHEGAATGVGGIVRDIFTMGARPIAILDSLRFGPLSDARNRYLFTNVVGGIGGYGNCLGIPTVGGEIFFDPCYNGNPLVNAMCIGVTKHDTIMRATASGPGNVIMLIGADTGRDGLHGATFASVDNPEESHRGVIQVGNPFLEKLLLEACLELLEGNDVVAMQDLGAAGLTSSTVECASRGGVGAEIDVALVPRRETGMNAYEIMLSESQERMLLVVRPDAEDRVTEIVHRWSLHASVIGRITDDGMVRIKDGDLIVAETPAELYTDACPTYVRPAVESAVVQEARARDLTTIPDLAESEFADTLLTLLGSPNICSRRPVYRRYDHTILTNTVVAPGAGDAAVVRIKGTNRAIATAIDCNPRYVYLDPALGAAHAVAEASRNVACAGGRPLAVTNCLNFGNPEKPAGYYQLSEAVRGMGEACRALEIPVVSGNVSLYNESADGAIFPTPTVGVVGVIDNVNRRATMTWREGDVLGLIIGAEAQLGASEYLATVHGITAGSPPDLDLAVERQVQELVRDVVADGSIRTAHDCSEGGLAVALAEMAIVSNVGCEIDANVKPAEDRLNEFWFGEGPSRIVIAGEQSAIDRIGTLAGDREIGFTVLGRVTGDVIVIGDVKVSLADATQRFEIGLVELS
ncbi:MAG: phosphoribosylformylglycinamidine synthase subunit PurL [Thermomicrobiales bacterium]|nr:phosphoribosylformylglycinamidine synthase subunit PurL [Thermomicrobiales bacterium]